MGAALAALMDRRKAVEPLSLRMLMLQQVEKSKRKKLQKLLLLNVIETYFKLTAEQNEKFSKLLEKKEYREVREMVVTWADEIAEKAHAKGLEKGLEAGREEGRQSGQLAGKREALLQQLITKFGPLPEHATSRLHSTESLDVLDVYLDRVLTAESLEEMGL